MTIPPCPHCGGAGYDVSTGGMTEYRCSRLCGEVYWPAPEPSHIELYVQDQLLDEDKPRVGRPPKQGSTLAKAMVEQCPQGHEYTEANTYMNGGFRNCRLCRRNKKYQHRGEVRDREVTTTHCRNGHEWTTENTSIKSNGARRCLICLKAINDRKREADCVNGHPQTKGAYRIRPSDGRRQCLACASNQQRARRAKKRQEANKAWQQQQNGAAA